MCVAVVHVVADPSPVWLSLQTSIRLMVCDGTGVPRGGVGGPQAPKLGGGEERPPTETGGGRPTGQPIEASHSKLALRE